MKGMKGWIDDSREGMNGWMEWKQHQQEEREKERKTQTWIVRDLWCEVHSFRFQTTGVVILLPSHQGTPDFADDDPEEVWDEDEDCTEKKQSKHDDQSTTLTKAFSQTILLFFFFFFFKKKNHFSHHFIHFRFFSQPSKLTQDTTQKVVEGDIVEHLVRHCSNSRTGWDGMDG